MGASRDWGVSQTLVHVIDREADSVGHYRQWDEAGHRFLVRADDRRVLWKGRDVLLTEVVKKLAAKRALTDLRAVEYRGQSARQHVGQTTVVLHRPAKKREHGKQRQIAGKPLRLRLVVVRVCDDAGKVLATWMLLTNLEESEVDAALIALWYYWRWQIESFFKLLKSHGQAIEHWQQKTGEAIAKRLMVASMACVVVWDLQRQDSPEAEVMKQLLIRLSGRRMKRTRPFTAPALLAGLFVLLPMLQLIDRLDGDLRPLQTLAEQTLPLLDTS